MNMPKIFMKDKNEKYYKEYKEVFKRMVSEEGNSPNLPILYNVNIGHSSPICIVPYGVDIEMDLKNKKIILIEKSLID